MDDNRNKLNAKVDSSTLDSLREAMTPTQDIYDGEKIEYHDEPTSYPQVEKMYEKTGNIPYEIPEPQLTFGQKLVGLTFNPSGDPAVNEVKLLFAKAADIVHDNWCRDGYTEKSPLENEIYHHAIGEILNAQMSAVKALTFKY